MRTIILTCAAIALCSCGATPERVATTSNAGLKVEVLGSAEGCTVYRFKDGDNGPFYFVRCPGQSTVSMMGKRSRGKYGVEELAVETIDGAEK